MKKYLLFLFALLIGVASFAIIQSDDDSPKRDPAAKAERRELREKRRAERLERYEKFIDSLILSRNWQFNPQTMQQEPAGAMRIITNPNYEVTLWDDTADICIPYIKGYVPPYYMTIINYTVPGISNYMAEQTSEGWMVSFTTSLYSATTYTFIFEISAKMGGGTLTIKNPWYNTVQYTGTITQLY